MKITLRDTYVVTPAEPTWQGRIALSETDQIGNIMHLPIIYFYRPPPDSTPDDKVLNTLIDSLSKALVYFYPFAGRLRWLDGGRLELDCNAAGVQLTTAETEITIDDLGADFVKSYQFDQYLIPAVDYHLTPIEDLPLLLVQLTKFRHGGFSIGMIMSHAVADGYSALYFYSEWARLARGESLTAAPFLDRKLLRAGDPPTSAPKFRHDEYMNDPPGMLGLDLETSIENERKKETTVGILKLTKSQVEILKKKANESNNTGKAFSRYEVLTGHIWKCVCKARKHKSEQPTGLGISVDVRRRVQPPLPPTYFGNAVIDVVATGSSGKLATNSLAYAAGRIRIAVDQVTHDYVHSLIDFFKHQPDLTPYQDMHKLKFYGNPNLGVTSWITLPFHGLDFGWGKDIHMHPGTHVYSDGDMIALPSSSGEEGSVAVLVCLISDHMEDFKEFFYEEFISDNGRLLVADQN